MKRASWGAISLVLVSCGPVAGPVPRETPSRESSTRDEKSMHNMQRHMEETMMPKVGAGSPNDSQTTGMPPKESS